MCASLTGFAVALTLSFELAEATRRNMEITTILGRAKEQKSWTVTSFSVFWTPRELKQVPSLDQVH